MSNCPACGAPLNPKPDTTGFECTYCHSVFFPGEEDDCVQVTSNVQDSNLSPSLAPGLDGGLACPVCRVPLVAASIATIPLLYCTQCHGLLLPMGALESAIDEARASAANSTVHTPADRDDLKRVIQCPRCNRRMDTHFYAGPGNVVVDSCDDCLLVWLDRGELTRIARAPDMVASNSFDRF